MPKTEKTEKTVKTEKTDRAPGRNGARVKVKPTDVSPRGAHGGILIRVDDGERVMEFVISRSRARDVALALKKAVAVLDDIEFTDEEKGKKKKKEKEKRHE